MSMTSRANRAAFALGFAPQTAKGAVASSAAARMFAAESVEEDPQREFIHPQGSTGSLFNKDTFRHVTTAPIVTARLMGSRECLGVVLEMMTFGKPTVGAGQFTEANDTNNELSTWTFSGVRPGWNTAYTTSGGAILYVSIATNVINVYKDSGRSQLVATGAASAGTVTLTESNSSGLTGTVACTTATPTNNATITVTLNTISSAFATTPQRYWTLFIDDGKKLRTIADVVMKSANFSSADKGPLMIDCVFWGMSRTVGATALTASVPGNTIYAHNGDLVMRNDTAGSPVTQDPTQVSFSFDRDCVPIFGTGTGPQDIYSRIITCEIKATFEPTTELDTMLALVDTWDEVDLKFTNGGKLFSLASSKCTLQNPQHPDFSGDDVQARELTWVVVEETASSPAAALTITHQP